MCTATICNLFAFEVTQNFFSEYIVQDIAALWCTLLHFQTTRLRTREIRETDQRTVQSVGESLDTQNFTNKFTLTSFGSSFICFLFKLIYLI